MEKQQLDRLMRIARKTNSPVVVLDQNDEEMVILPLSSYEELIDGYLEDDLQIPEEFFEGGEFEGFEGEFESEEPLNEFEIEPEEFEIEELPSELEPVITQEAPSQQVKQVIGEEDLTEEQFYLEPVE